VARTREDGLTAAEIEALHARSIPDVQQVAEDPEASPALRRAAKYEWAQWLREQGEMETYYVLMQNIVEVMPEGRFLYEYAVQLYGDGRHTEAMPLFEGAIGLLEETDLQFSACMALADIHLLRNQPEEALQWLEAATAYQPPDRAWQLARARADYQLERYDDTLERLLPVAEDDDIFHMYIGFSFYNRTPSMPGLALTHMNRIRHPERLGTHQQFNFYANRAYLHYDQLRDPEAVADVTAALALRPDDALERVRMRAWLRDGALDEVIERGGQWLVSRENPPEVPEQVYEIMGLAAYRRRAWPEAITYFTAALERDEHLLQARYQRGLARLHTGEQDLAEQDLIGLTEHLDAFPPTLWGDLAFVLGILGEYEAGMEWLDRSLARYPYDIDAWQERGYQSMKDHRNPDARESFAAGIMLYNEVIPYVADPEDAETYTQTRKRLKQEYTKLDKTWSFQVYTQRTDFDFNESDLPAGVPGDSTTGALQSQGGVALGFRPPKIGFRNESTLDVIPRVLWNLEPNSWRPDEDSLQGGLGILYKPFTHHNYVQGLERLFKIGSNAEDNWLWRNLYGLEGGQRPQQGETLWLHHRLYGEISYYFEEPRRWIFFGQGNLGPSFHLTDNLLLTAPEALFVGRYQDNDPEGVGTYGYAGPGLSLRLLEGERALTRDRWAFTAHAHYVWGRFDLPPRNINGKTFEGWIIGVSLMK
jgi:tetratricopeptide (TPR) repeat protein